MNELFAALAVFLAVHTITAIRPLRAHLVALVGETLYVVLFSIVSLSLLVWLGVAYANAPYLETWLYIPELKWLMLLIMPIACLLIVSGLTSRNPFSLGMGSKYFDSAKPGIVGLTKHPAIWGLAI